MQRFFVTAFAAMQGALGVFAQKQPTLEMMRQNLQESQTRWEALKKQCNDSYTFTVRCNWSDIEASTGYEYTRIFEREIKVVNGKAVSAIAVERDAEVYEEMSREVATTYFNGEPLPTLDALYEQSKQWADAPPASFMLTFDQDTRLVRYAHAVDDEQMRYKNKLKHCKSEFSVQTVSPDNGATAQVVFAAQPIHGRWKLAAKQELPWMEDNLKGYSLDFRPNGTLEVFVLQIHRYGDGTAKESSFKTGYLLLAQKGSLQIPYYQTFGSGPYTGQPSVSQLGLDQVTRYELRGENLTLHTKDGKALRYIRESKPKK